MKHGFWIVALGIVFGLALWATDAYLDYFYYRAPSFVWALVDVSTQELGSRVMALIGFLAFGLLMSNAMLRQRQAEETLRQRNRDLNLLIAELQEKYKELDTFAHTVAHGLKNPLLPIIGFVEVLKEDNDTMPAAERRDLLQAVSQGVLKMNTIVDELLLLASVNKQEVKVKPLDMDSIVKEARQRLAGVIEERQAEIVLPDRWPEATGYAPWVEEVWVNYLSNALKYGGQPPRIQLGATLQSDSMVRFWVHDNGYGVSPEKQAYLFAPFSRLGPAEVHGNGLGLSIAGRIAHKLGGQVGIESDGVPGQGAFFYFTLPSARPVWQQDTN